MKWSTIKTIALVALAAVVLWQFGSFELLAGLGLGGWLERERRRSGPGGASNNSDAPERPPARQAETSHDVNREVSGATSDVSNSSSEGELADELDSLADDLKSQRKEQ
jgi:hypothetical protein